MTLGKIDDIVQETLNELWKMNDELMAEGRALDPSKHWERNSYFMQALGVGEATTKVIELGSKIRKAYYDEIDKENEKTRKTEWAERIEAREQEITYNRINGLC